MLGLYRAKIRIQIRRPVCVSVSEYTVVLGTPYILSFRTVRAVTFLCLYKLKDGGHDHMTVRTIL